MHGEALITITSRQMPTLYPPWERAMSAGVKWHVPVSLRTEPLSHCQPIPPCQPPTLEDSQANAVWIWIHLIFIYNL